MIAAHFREILAGDDAELGGQALEQHRDDVGEQHDPEQAVAVFRAGLDVGGEIARVHIGDRGDDRGTGKGQTRRASPRAGRPSTWRAVTSVRSDSDPGRPVGSVMASDSSRFVMAPVVLRLRWHAVPQHLP